MLRSAHLQQDEVIRQDNRQKAQQQKAADAPAEQASPITAQLQRETDEANRQDSLHKAQEQKASDEASREESLQRAQAVVSPFTRATVHRQIGKCVFLCAHTSKPVIHAFMHAIKQLQLPRTLNALYGANEVPPKRSCSKQAATMPYR